MLSHDGVIHGYDSYIKMSSYSSIMETVTVQKEVFSKILADVEVLLDDVESALNSKVKQRLHDITTGKIEAKTEEDLHDYLRKRGVKVE